MPGTLRINDVAVADPQIAGGVLTVPLPDLGASLTHTLSYRSTLNTSAAASVRNSATAAASGIASNTASVTIEVRRGFETDSKGVLTGTVYLACATTDVNANPGVPGIRLLLEALSGGHRATAGSQAVRGIASLSSSQAYVGAAVCLLFTICIIGMRAFRDEDDIYK